MAFGRFSSEQHQDAHNTPVSEMNVTPMVDVMLVLLIIFMVTVPLITQSLNITLPDSEGTQHQSPPSSIDIFIDANGVLYWSQTPISMYTLSAKFAQLSPAEEKPALQLHADKSTHYEVITDIMSIAQSYGISNIGFVTSPSIETKK